MKVHVVSNTRMARHGLGKSFLPILLFLGALATRAQNLPPSKAPLRDPSIVFSTNDTSLSKLMFHPTPGGIWENGVGEGFRSKTQSLTVSAGATYGLDSFGSREQHHLAIGSLSYGHMLGHAVGEGHWWHGNPELRLELFSGAQFDPDTRWFVGLTPHLRYNFATGTRWVPFVDGGAGVTATSIGPPDLSGTFEFN